MAQQETAPAPVHRGAHIADPAALGLGGFALTTFVLSVVNAGLVDPAAEAVVFGLAFAYGGIAQFAAGLWEFTKGNTFGATAFCSFGGFWISFWWLTGNNVEALGDSAPEGLGLYLLAWGIFTLYMTVAALKTNSAVLTVFVLLTLTFFVLAIGEFATSAGWTKFGGWLGIATALVAWYASFATVTNSTFKKIVLPVGPRE